MGWNRQPLSACWWARALKLAESQCRACSEAAAQVIEPATAFLALLGDGHDHRLGCSLGSCLLGRVLLRGHACLSLLTVMYAAKLLQLLIAV